MVLPLFRTGAVAAEIVFTTPRSSKKYIALVETTVSLCVVFKFHPQAMVISTGSNWQMLERDHADRIPNAA